MLRNAWGELVFPKIIRPEIRFRNKNQWMDKMTDKFSKIVLFLLCGISGTCLGLIFPLALDLAKDQGLAAGAIVVGYAFLGLLSGFIIASVFVFKLESETVKKMNKMFAVVNIFLMTSFFLLVKLKTQ